jgi:hypothetical protein
MMNDPKKDTGNKCNNCSAPIAWEKNANNKWVPYDLDGEIHFATCTSNQKPSHKKYHPPKSDPQLTLIADRLLLIINLLKQMNQTNTNQPPLTSTEKLIDTPLLEANDNGLTDLLDVNEQQITNEANAILNNIKMRTYTTDGSELDKDSPF